MAPKEKIVLVDKNLRTVNARIDNGVWTTKFKVRLGRHNTAWVFNGDFDDDCRYAGFRSTSAAEEFIRKQRSIRAANHISAAAKLTRR